MARSNDIAAKCVLRAKDAAQFGTCTSQLRRHDVRSPSLMPIRIGERSPSAAGCGCAGGKPLKQFLKLIARIIVLVVALAVSAAVSVVYKLQSRRRCRLDASAGCEVSYQLDRLKLELATEPSSLHGYLRPHETPNLGVHQTGSSSKDNSRVQGV